MKTRQINKLAAFIALVSVCKQAQSIWSALKAFKDKLAKFCTRVETLGRLKLQQESGPAASRRRSNRAGNRRAPLVRSWPPPCARGRRIRAISPLPAR